jgi:uncharacterized protein YndB with AHSA1/START domain
MPTNTHTASRIILASARAIFRAFVDPEVLVKWRAPAGMTARVSSFDPRVGGGYRMKLTYVGEGVGKTDSRSDVVAVRFLELLPDETIIEAVTFESDQPDLAGRMTLTTSLRALTDGVRVTFVAEDVPHGISEADHQKGMDSALKNLATLLE